MRRSGAHYAVLGFESRSRPVQKPWGRLFSLPSQHFDATVNQKIAEVADKNVCPMSASPQGGALWQPGV